jgi:hypothetical protein
METSGISRWASFWLSSTLILSCFFHSLDSYFHVMLVLENAVQFRSFRRLTNEEEGDLITQLLSTQFTSVQASNLWSALDIAVLSDAHLRLRPR